MNSEFNMDWLKTTNSEPPARLTKFNVCSDRALLTIILPHNINREKMTKNLFIKHTPSNLLKAIFVENTLIGCFDTLNGI